jgi:hypothetical protein
MGCRLCLLIQASILLFLDQTPLLLWYEHVMSCPPNLFMSFVFLPKMYCNIFPLLTAPLISMLPPHFVDETML